MSFPPNIGSAHHATSRGAVWLGAAHLVVDAVCVASVLRASPPTGSVAASALAFVLGYDLLAFAGQVPFGWLVDRLGLRRGAVLAGLALAASALVAGPSAGVAVMVLAGIGNALFHTGAGAMVLAGSEGRAAPAGIFVAPGALGLGLGIALGREWPQAALWPWLFALVVAAVAVLRVSRPDELGKLSVPAAPPQSHAWVAIIACLLSLSVAVRSLVGTVACDGCPPGIFLMAAIPVAGFAGKLVGGFLADRYGWINLSMVALLASAPLLAFSDGDFWLAIPGLFVFQMTMPVTLTAILRLMPARPGFGFGVLCAALVVGTLPAYLPGGWRPYGLPLLFLVLGAAVALYVALRRVLGPNSSPAFPSTLVPPTIERGPQ